MQTFPGSDWVTSQAALAHYNCRNFDTAQALYEDLLERDPWRLQVSQGAGGGGEGGRQSSQGVVEQVVAIVVADNVLVRAGVCATASCMKICWIGTHGACRSDSQSGRQ